jgi:hypothetical protein
LIDPISKITGAKWTGDVAQVVAGTLYESLSSNPSPGKKKKENPEKLRNLQVLTQLEWRKLELNLTFWPTSYINAKYTPCHKSYISSPKLSDNYMVPNSLQTISLIILPLVGILK